MGGEASCPRCDSQLRSAAAVCPRCGFVLVEERIAGRPRLVSRLGRRRRTAAIVAALAATALGAAGAAALVIFRAADALAPSTEPLSAVEAERRLAIRYPHLRQVEEAVIACPNRAIQPGGQARCWILARVGLQRSVIVRLSRRGNSVQIDD